MQHAVFLCPLPFPTVLPLRALLSYFPAVERQLLRRLLPSPRCGLRGWAQAGARGLPALLRWAAGADPLEAVVGIRGRRRRHRDGHQARSLTLHSFHYAALSLEKNIR